VAQLGISSASVARILREFGPEALRGVPEQWHPVGAPLGCGHYGCVYATSAPDVVLKVSTDPTEVKFIDWAMALAAAEGGWPDGIVRYHKAVVLPSQFRGRPSALIWREGAFDVGKVLSPQVIHRHDYEGRAKREFANMLLTFQRHAGQVVSVVRRAKHPEKVLEQTLALASWAADYVDDRVTWDFSGWNNIPLPNVKSAYRAAMCLRICEVTAEFMEHANEFSTYVGATLGHYLDRGALLADVHTGNVGAVLRDDFSRPIVVITDPGHAFIVEGGFFRSRR
jgi:hypothetical protein